MNTLPLTARVVVGAFAAMVTLQTAPATATATPFDLERGNSAVDVIIPAVIPPLFQTTTPNDAPIILRHTTLITNAWFDAIAPYHPTAKGVYSRLGRRPAIEHTSRNKNTAMLYASYRLLSTLMPRFALNWRGMMTSVASTPTMRARTRRRRSASATGRAGPSLPRAPTTA